MPDSRQARRIASVRFSLTDISGMMPSTLRSSEQKAMPILDRVDRLAEGDRLPSMVIVPASGWVGPENHARHLGAARAEKAGESDDLAGANRQADVLDLRPRLQPIGGDQRMIGGMPSPWKWSGPRGAVCRSRPSMAGDQLELADGLPCRSFATLRPSRMTVTRSHTAIELVELMADEDHRHAGFAQLPDDTVEGSRPRGRQATTSVRP